MLDQPHRRPVQARGRVFDVRDEWRRRGDDGGAETPASTDAMTRTSQERARLTKLFAELSRADIKSAILGLRPKVGGELRRVIDTRGAAVGVVWPPLSREYAARKTRL